MTKRHKRVVNKLKKVKLQKIKLQEKRLRLFAGVTFMLFFGGVGAVLLWRSQAAPGVCSTTGTIGSANYTVSVPQTSTYRVWVRMQVPDTTNTGNNNGVRLELDGAQCFQVTTTNAAAVSGWQWVNSDATAASTAHVTSQIASGNRNMKLLGMKAGVKVDRVMLLLSSNTCVPSNDFTNGSPGDNCTVDAPTVTLTANPTSVITGAQSTLTWSTTDATSCTSSGSWSGSRPTSGTFQTGALSASQTYTLTCIGLAGSANQTATVTVTNPTPTVTISANPTSVTSGNASTLTWSSTAATSCVASGGWTGTKAVSGTQSTGNLTSNQTFTLTCTGPGGSGNQSASVTVTPAPAPTLTLGASPTSVSSGGSSTLTWSTTNATSCTASGAWSGSRATSGSFATGALSSNQTYTLTCTGAGGSINRSATVTVTTTPPPDTTAPTVTFTLPGLNLGASDTAITVNNLKSVRWQPTASDAGGLQSVVYRLDGQTVTLSAGELVVGAARNGDYVVQAVATDTANNTTTKSLTIRLRHPDFDRNGSVALLDMSRLLQAWGTVNTQYDINISNRVDLFDLSFVLSRWGATN